MHKLLLFFTSFSFFLLMSTSSIAQSNQEETVDSVAVMNWLSKNFSFNRPDTGFVALGEGNGYSNPTINATIKYISFPQKFIKVKSQFADRKPTETTLLVDTIKHSSNGLAAFSLIQEEVSPDKSKYENYISITTIVDFKDITACIIGAYPKSKDKILREKFIKAALSIKEQ
jgi:hypothetical protein